MCIGVQANFVACTTINTFKEYKWNVSACQPEHFLAEIYRGSLHYGKAKATPVPYGGILKSGWYKVKEEPLIGVETQKKLKKCEIKNICKFSLYVI